MTVRAWLSALLVAALALTGLAAPADAARSTPGDFTGYAFDTCEAPSQTEMDEWLTTSPFWAVGVYIGGSARLCTDQEHLTEAWVRRQTARGWRILPLWVGPQAACTSYADRIDASPADDYEAAAAQGRQAARHAVREARALGIPRRSTLWYDLEDFPLSDDDCRRSALRFLSAWTQRLHTLHFRSGVYSNVASGIHALDYADKVSPGSYTMPDHVWYAWDNGRDDTHIPRRWVRRSSWTPGGRMHQYALDVSATYGGVTMSIDRSFLDLGRGSVAPAPPRSCGVRVSFPTYRRLSRGSTGSQVKAVQCLLRQNGGYDGRVHGHFNRATLRAVRSYQRSRDLRVSGLVTASTWTVLLSEGSSPVLKFGSAGNAVRRVQRALNAADRAELAVTGVFEAATERAARAYQQRVGLPLTGVVAADTWSALESGRR